MLLFFLKKKKVNNKIMLSQNNSKPLCNQCGKEYIRIQKFCNPCYIKNYFTNWTSGNDKIDKFIEKIQLKTTKLRNIIEWIPYTQFIGIKEIRKDDDNLITMYSAIWENGPLDNHKEKPIRKSNEKVVLKRLYNSKNRIDEFLNEV
jgi:hypothetical protein